MAPVTSVPMVKAGKVKAFAVTSSQRMPALPDVPTFAEQGFPAMTQVIWIGLWVANDVPAPVQDRLREAALKALQQPVVRGRLSPWAWSPVSPRPLTSWPSRCVSPTTAKRSPEIDQLQTGVNLHWIHAWIRTRAATFMSRRCASR